MLEPFFQYSSGKEDNLRDPALLPRGCPLFTAEAFNSHGAEEGARGMQDEQDFPPLFLDLDKV